MVDVQRFVEENPHFEIIKDDQGCEKVKCKLSGHELPYRLAEINTYVNGKKYQRLLKGLANENVLEEYKQYLVPAEKTRNQLYCKLTKKLINNIPQHIEVHVKGRRFQKALIEQQENNKSKGDEGPNIDNNQGELCLETKSTSEPDISLLEKAFGEDNDDGNHGYVDGIMHEIGKKKNKKRDNKSLELISNETRKQGLSKKNKAVKSKFINTRKRKLKEEANDQKKTSKKTKKQSKIKGPPRKKVKRPINK